MAAAWGDDAEQTQIGGNINATHQKADADATTEQNNSVTIVSGCKKRCVINVAQNNNATTTANANNSNSTQQSNNQTQSAGVSPAPILGSPAILTSATTAATVPTTAAPAKTKSLKKKTAKKAKKAKAKSKKRAKARKRSSRTKCTCSGGSIKKIGGGPPLGTAENRESTWKNSQRSGVYR